MIDLLESRDKIDKIDMEIVRLFEERMKICEDVAEYKIATGKKVLDAERERQKLKALLADFFHSKLALSYFDNNFPDLQD